MLLPFLLFALFFRQTESTGKGPVGIYAIDSRFVIIADSEHNGVFVVDLVVGGIVGRRLWPGDRDPPKTWASMTGVASCPVCNFIYATTTHQPYFWRLDISTPLSKMAEARNFSSLSSAPLVPLPFSGFGTTRMLTIASDGRRGFVADYYEGCWSFDPLSDTVSLNSSMRLVVGKQSHLHGEGAAGVVLSKDEATLFVTTSEAVYAVHENRGQSHKPVKLRVDVFNHCGLSKDSRLRETVPLEDGTLVVLGRHMKSSPNPGGQLFLLKPDINASSTKYTCESIAGSQDFGWIDGAGIRARFSRPHQIVRRPNSDEVIATDIDNRAIRLISLDETRFGHVSTVRYDNQLFSRLWGAKSLAPPPPSNIVPSSQSNTHQSYFLAKRFCEDQSLQLCSPEDLRADAGASFSSTGPRKEVPRPVWTRSNCSSCWLHYPGTCRQVVPCSESVRALGFSYWGCGTPLLAFITGHGASFEMRAECTDAMLPLSTVSVCCCASSSQETRTISL